MGGGEWMLWEFFHKSKKVRAYIFYITTSKEDLCVVV